MRIAMVTEQAISKDIRIEKEVGSLIEAGHEVFVCEPTAGSVGDSLGRYGVAELGESLSALSAVAGSLHRVLSALKPEVLHIQDTPASLEGFLAAKCLSLPFILDIHEIWPSLVLENSPAVTNREVFWSKSLLLREAITSFAADAVLTVVAEATKYYLERYHFLNGRVFSICNYEIGKRLQDIQPSDEVKDLDCFKVAYIGGIDGPIRGLEEVIIAARLLSKSDVRILIVGSGSHLRQLRLLTNQLGVNDTVRFFGARSFHDAMSIASASDVCLVPHRKAVATDNTLPHKISQYMFFHKPVVSTPLDPIKRLFASAFIEWEPRTPEKLAEIIISIRDNPSLALEAARKAYGLVSDKYRWEDEGKKLVAVYEELAAR